MTTLDTHALAGIAASGRSAARDSFLLIPPAAHDDRPADPLKPTLVPYRIPASHIPTQRDSPTRPAQPAEDEGDVYRAGQRVPPGSYQEIDGLRHIELAEEGFLPASCDGRRAWFRRVERAWWHGLNAAKAAS